MAVINIIAKKINPFLNLTRILGRVNQFSFFVYTIVRKLNSTCVYHLPTIRSFLSLHNVP